MDYAELFKQADREALGEVRALLGANRDRVVNIFRSWDFDNSSSISLAELRRALAALSIPINKRALRSLFREMDASGSGSVDFSELRAFLKPKLYEDSPESRYDIHQKSYVVSHAAVRLLDKNAPDSNSASKSSVVRLPSIHGRQPGASRALAEGARATDFARQSDARILQARDTRLQTEAAARERANYLEELKAQQAKSMVNKRSEGRLKMAEGLAARFND